MEGVSKRAIAFKMLHHFGSHIYGVLLLCLYILTKTLHFSKASAHFSILFVQFSNHINQQRNAAKCIALCNCLSV